MYDGLLSLSEFLGCEPLKFSELGAAVKRNCFNKFRAYIFTGIDNITYTMKLAFVCKTVNSTNSFEINVFFWGTSETNQLNN